MQIHETAFVVSTYRSMYETVSQDHFAKLWNNPKTDALIPNILKTISKDEALLHALRNRFFYEFMTSYFEKHGGGTLVNFGAGFSMYQFQLSEQVNTIEIDKKDIIDHKKDRIDQWMNNGALPKRNIEYLALDFNEDSEAQMVSTLKPLIRKAPIFILVEGVLFFLDQKTCDKLFSVFAKLQKKGDCIGSVSYLPEVEDTKVYKRLLHYFDSNNDTEDPFSHQTTPQKYYENLDGYQLLEAADGFGLSKVYAKAHEALIKKEILNESMYILQRS